MHLFCRCLFLYLKGWDSESLANRLVQKGLGNKKQGQVLKGRQTKVKMSHREIEELMGA